MSGGNSAGTLWPLSLWEQGTFWCGQSEHDRKTKGNSQARTGRQVRTHEPGDLTGGQRQGLTHSDDREEVSFLVLET